MQAIATQPLARGGTFTSARTAILGLLLIVHAITGAGRAAAQPLNEEIQRIIARTRLGADAKVGVSVLDTQTRAVVAALRANEPFTPASNMKLLSSGAAVLVLGSDFVFSTEVIHDGTKLVLRGSGDPAFADPDVLDKMSPKMTVDDVLGIVAGAVAKANVGKIDALVVDDRVFDREYVHPTWPVRQLGDWYCAQISGLNFHTNVLSVFPRPSPDGPGKRAVRTVEPDASWLSIENQTRTVRDGKNAISLVRLPGEENAFRLSGDVRFPTQVPVETTLHNPALFCGQVLADRLEKAGVVIGEPSAKGSPTPNRAVRLAAPEEAINTDRVLARVTTPMSDILRRCNKDSHNLYAEALLKRVGFETTGEPGSWKNGAAVLRMLLTQKIDPQAAASTTIADGSGMSRENKVAPSVLTRWLAVIANEDSELKHTFVDSLALPGEGTLRERFQGAKLRNEVRGKSGYIKGVRTLSGYVTHRETGRRVAFSIMINNVGDDAGAIAKKLHEEIVVEVDRWLTRQAGTAKPALGG